MPRRDRVLSDTASTLNARDSLSAHGAGHGGSSMSGGEGGPPDGSDERQGLLSPRTGREGASAAPPSCWERFKLAMSPSLVVVYYQCFLSTFTTTLVIPSMWTFVQGLDASSGFYGWCMASFNISAFLSLPLLGRWADVRPIKEPLIVSGIVSIVGLVIYGAARNKWLLLAGRFISGIGLGSSALPRTYVAKTTTDAERTPALTTVAMANSLG